jgi:hypothetical protein
MCGHAVYNRRGLGEVISGMAQEATSRAPASAAKWCVAAALAVAAGALLWFAGAGAAQDARPAAGSAEGQSVLLVAGQVTSDSYGLYLVDTRSRTMCVYQWQPASRKMRLMSARFYGYDLQLDDYNNEKETAPAEIRKLVEQQRRLGASTQPN